MFTHEVIVFLLVKGIWNKNKVSNTYGNLKYCRQLYRDILTSYLGFSLVFPMELIENGNLIGSINGKVVGGAALVAGKKGLALSTDGQQYVDFGCQGNTCLGSISLCVHGWVTAFWIQPIGDVGFIMDGGVYNGFERVLIQKYKLNFKARLTSLDKEWRVSIALPSLESWLHIVLTWQPRCGFKVYFDGELAVIDDLPDIPSVPNKAIPRFVLGASNIYTFKYKMVLDELRIWDTVMSDEDDLALYTVDTGLD